MYIILYTGQQLYIYVNINLAFCVYIRFVSLHGITYQVCQSSWYNILGFFSLRGITYQVCQSSWNNSIIIRLSSNNLYFVLANYCSSFSNSRMLDMVGASDLKKTAGTVFFSFQFYRNQQVTTERSVQHTVAQFSICSIGNEKLHTI